MRALFNTDKEKARQSDSHEDSEDDQFEIPLPRQAPTIFGSFQPSLFVPPDQLGADDPTRYSVRSWASVLLANKTKPFK